MDPRPTQTEQSEQTEPIPNAPTALPERPREQPGDDEAPNEKDPESDDSTLSPSEAGHVKRGEGDG